MTKRSGLTLIEVLLAMGLSLIIAGVVGAVFFDSWKAQIGQEAYTELQQKSRQAVDEISSQVQTASGVVASVTSGSTTYTTNANTVVLKMPSLDVNNNILSGTDYIVFRRRPAATNNLERIVIADAASSRTSLRTPLILNDRTTTLEFQYYNLAGSELVPGTGDLTTSESLFVHVVSSKLVNGRTLVREIDNTVHLRNN